MAASAGRGDRGRGPAYASAMRPVVVLIFHAEAPAGAGPLTRSLAEARRSLAGVQREAWLRAGADEAVIVAGPPDGRTFGERLGAEVRARMATGRGAGTATARGVVALGSGSLPLAGAADLRRFVQAAAGPPGHVLANNRYSADVVAVSRAADLADLPPLPADNALPRYLEEKAGLAVTDLRNRWRLGVDVDTPLDLLLLGGARARPIRALLGTEPLIGERLAALSDFLRNRRAELLVAGRISASTFRWLERGVACRVRALVEERGLRASSPLAQAGAPTTGRPPRSILGEMLDRDGPESLSQLVAGLADAAVIDSRVLLAHRCGADESAWPVAEDRFASDLLLAPTIADPWLAALTQAAISSDHPIVLGGHTALNGGLRLLAQRARAGAR
jgi:hypothetical protein